MDKITKFVCEKRFLILIISIGLIFLSFIGMQLTKINYDILLYLPREFETIKGQTVLTNDFNMGGYSIAIAENMNAKDILNLEEKIKNVSGVANIVSIYDVIGTNLPIEMLPNEVKDKLYKDNIDILFITFKESTSSDLTINAVKEIRTITNGKIAQGGMSSLILDTRTLTQKEITIYVIIAVTLCILVLQISLDSYFVPFILLLNIGCAILFNLGTNIFLGQISYITKALVAVLQLGVTTDFSIFLYHSYEDKKKIYENRIEAMSLAIKETFLSVTGSSLTTIVGFLALCAMRLGLGTDLGVVMAKGVLLGVITVLTLFPSLILVFDNLINKTKHKELMPKFNKLNKIITNNYKLIFIIFAILLIPSYIASKKVEVYYKLDSSLPDTLESIKTNNLLTEKFNITSPEIILINKNIKNDEVMSMVNQIRKLEGIDFILSFRELKEKGLTEDIIPKELTNIFESDKYELIIVNSDYDIATIEMNNQIDELNKIVKNYDKDAIVAGEGPLTKDLVETYATDYKYVNIFSIGCIFIVLLFVFKEINLPILLIITIEFAIFMNLGISYFKGTILPFIATITLGTIQLGATIDYAILVTTNYLNKRKEITDKKEAILETMNYSVPSILISGMCFFAATIGVGLYSDIAMIGVICVLLARGALISVLVVLTILPTILLIFDKYIIKDKTKDKGRFKMFNKITKKALVLLLINIILIPNVYATEKNEYVYGKLDNKGNVKNIIVNKQIINNENLNILEDYSELENILNIKNNATYQIKDNKMIWNASGKDIFYRGTTNKELPISVNITYFLNDKLINPEDILGQSGNIKIKIKYTNKEKHGSLYTPFVVLLGTIIDGENNTNVNITNGKVVNNGSNNIVIGLATPGIYESLNLKEFKNMDTITITYKTQKFELAAMYTVATSKLIDKSDLNIFNKMDDLYQKVNSLQDGMNKIENGAKELNTGLVALQSKYDNFNNGLINFKNNFNTLNNGVKEMQSEVNNLLKQEEIVKLREDLPKLKENATKIKNITNKYGNDIEKVLNTSSNIVDGLTEDILKILNYLKTVEEYLKNNTDYNELIEESITSINNYIDSINTFLDNINSYLTNFNNISDFTNNSLDYIINTYENDPANASPELTQLYNEAIKIKNNSNLNIISDSLNIDINNLNKLKNNLKIVNEKINNLANKLIIQDNTLNNDFDNIENIVINLETIEEKIKTTNKNIYSDIDKINKGLNVIDKLPEQIETIDQGITKFENGMNSISDGTNKLYEGINTLTNYSNQINEGIITLSKGSTELTKGITEYNNEGISKLNNLVNKDVKNIVNKVKKLIDLGNDYSSFTSGNEKDNNTKFVMVTDSIKAPIDKKVITESKKMNFWERIKNLFS